MVGEAFGVFRVREHGERIKIKQDSGQSPFCKCETSKGKCKGEKITVHARKQTSGKKGIPRINGENRKLKGGKKGT